MQTAAARALKKEKKIPDKLFYKIGEISKITDVESYVLRYWETEFPFLNPRKSRSGQRIYSKKDLDIIFEIKNLLYNERYTIEGVRKRFGETSHGKRTGTGPKGTKSVGKIQSADSAINHTKKKLREIINQLS